MGIQYKSEQAYGALAITPSDATDLSAYEFRGFYVGVGGDVAIEQPGNDTPVVFKNVPEGAILPIAITKVNATSTTATDILGLL